MSEVMRTPVSIIDDELTVFQNPKARYLLPNIPRAPVLLFLLVSDIFLTEGN